MREAFLAVRVVRRGTSSNGFMSCKHSDNIQSDRSWFPIIIAVNIDVIYIHYGGMDNNAR